MSINHDKLRSRLSNALAVLSCLAVTSSLAVLIVLLVYTHGNDSNHTGFEPWLLSIIFVATVSVGIAAFLYGNLRWGALLACCLGFGGMAFLFYIDHFNVLVQYDRLLARGGL